MRLFLIGRIAIFVIPALLLSGCHKNKSYWESDKVQTGIEEYDSAKISSIKADGSTPLQLHIIRSKEDLTLYLTSTNFPFSGYNKDPYYTKVNVYLDANEKVSFLAERHKGGYRLKLPLEHGRVIIESLLANKSVSVEASDFKVVLRHEGFKKQFDQMLGFSFSDLPVSIGF